MTAQNQIRSLVERINRLKDEQDALGTDIREVYAEAKANGIDKTALGQVVTTVRRMGKDPMKFNENNALVEIYMSAYESGTAVATRVQAHDGTVEAA